MERVRDNYNTQIQNLKDIRQYGSTQLSAVRGQYYEQVSDRNGLPTNHDQIYLSTKWYYALGFTLPYVNRSLRFTNKSHTKATLLSEMVEHNGLTHVGRSHLVQKNLLVRPCFK